MSYLCPFIIYSELRAVHSENHPSLSGIISQFPYIRQFNSRVQGLGIGYRNKRKFDSRSVTTSLLEVGVDDEDILNDAIIFAPTLIDSLKHEMADVSKVISFQGTCVLVPFCVTSTST